MSYVKPVVASAEACLTPLSCGTDTKTTSEADSPPLRTECVGTNPRALKFQKLSQKGTTNGLPTIPRMGPITPTSIHTEHGCVTPPVETHRSLCVEALKSWNACTHGAVKYSGDHVLVFPPE